MLIQDQENHCIAICRAMTKAEYMCGIMGDDSAEFIIEQARGLERMSLSDWMRWVERQGDNLKCVHHGHWHIACVTYCKAK